MPEASRGRRGAEEASHRLKSPMTATDAAFGAQTAKYVPGVPLTSIGCAPSLSYRRAGFPSVKRERCPWGWRGASPVAGVFVIGDRAAAALRESPGYPPP